MKITIENLKKINISEKHIESWASIGSPNNLKDLIQLGIKNEKFDLVNLYLTGIMNHDEKHKYILYSVNLLETFYKNMFPDSTFESFRNKTRMHDVSRAAAFANFTASAAAYYKRFNFIEAAELYKKTWNDIIQYGSSLVDKNKHFTIKLIKR